MFLSKDRVGTPHFVAYLILTLLVFLGTLVPYYLMGGAGIIQAVALLVVVGFLSTRDHIPIGMHGRLYYQWRLAEGSITPPSRVPGWIARFAAEPDPLLVLGSMFGVVLSAPVFLIYDLCVSDRLMAKAIVDLGWLQLLFLPHLVGYTTWSLVAFRRSLLERIYKIACAEPVLT